MASIVPTVGRIVLFTLANYQAEAINRRYEHALNSMDYHRWKKNGSAIHVGNPVQGGDILPAIVVKVWGNTPDCAVNLKVFLDGADDFWVTSTSVGDSPAHEGRYHWMDYQKGQAAKAEKAEAALQAADIGSQGVAAPVTDGRAS